MTHLLVVNSTDPFVGGDFFSEIAGYQYLYRELHDSDEAVASDRASCAMIGVPAEMSREEMLAFFEPYAPEITKYTIIRDIDLPGSKTVVIDFSSIESMDSFRRLYCNLHFPSHPTAPPCLVMSLSEVIIMDDPAAPSPTFTLHKRMPLDNLISNSISSATEGNQIIPVQEEKVFPSVSVDDAISTASSDSFQRNPVTITSEQSTDVPDAPLLENVGGGHGHVDGDGVKASSPSRGDFLSPPPPPRLRLPNCPVCLRRIKSCVSGVKGSDEIIIGPEFAGNGDRCPVCLVSSDEGESRRVCGVCGLHENLWACLQCGYVGCGRYTAQHAKKHFHSNGHPFSLELVTQRIWDYVNDTFVHIDPFAVFSRTLEEDSVASSRHYESAQERGRAQRFSQEPPLVLQSSLQSSATHISHPDTADASLTRLEPPSGQPAWVVEKPEDMMFSRREYIAQHLDCAIVDKLGVMQSDYERIMEQQLRDQRLHYEKMIARETVRLLEMGFNVQNGKVVGFPPSLVPNGSKDQHGDGEEKGEEKLKPTMIGSEDTDELINVDLSREQKIASDLEEIEKLKLEISSLEYDYSNKLQEIRVAEKETLEARKENDKLMKEQNMLKQRVHEYTTRTEEIKQQGKEQVESLQQQIMELEFYIRTQKEVNESPYKNEVREGVVIVQEGAAPMGSLASGSSRVSGGGKHKKKAAKK